MKTLPRWQVACAAVLFAGGLSFAPRSASPEAHGEPSAAADPSAAAPAPDRAGAEVLSRALASTGHPTPPGLDASVVEEAGQLTVTVRHPRRLVALRTGDALTAGRDWASLRLSATASRAGDRDAPPPTLAWESTDAATLVTTRGILAVGADGAPVLAMAEAPRVAAEHRGRAHLCRAHEDFDGGFSMVCRLEPQAARVRAANLLDAEPLQHAWVVPADREAARGELVRFDLPRVQGGRAVALSYLLGARAVIVRAEASRLPEEHAPTLFLGENERIQPLPWF